MRLLFLFMVGILLISTLHAQNTNPKITKAQKEELKLINDIEKDAVKYRKKLNKALKKGEIGAQYQVDVEIEMYKIDEYVSRKLKKDNSSLNYIGLLIKAESEYQKLLRKHYRMLAGMLSKKDQDLFIQAQNAWDKWMPHERKFNAILSDSIYIINQSDIEISAEKYLGITKNRLLDILDYMARIKPDEK